MRGRLLVEEGGVEVFPGGAGLVVGGVAGAGPFSTHANLSNIIKCSIGLKLLQYHNIFEH